MTIEDIKKLYYEEGLSTRQIADKLGKTVWQVISFMKKYKMDRRSSAETQRLQFARTPLSYQKKEILSSEDRELWIAGLSLYWAEGVKFIGNHIVDLANSDEKIILLFLAMLRIVYHIDEKRLRVLLYSYENQNQFELITYWSKLLSIHSSQFTKPYIRKDFKLDKEDKMLHGLVHVRYNDIRLFRQIMTDIGIICSMLLGCRSGQSDLSVKQAAERPT